jgi:hypothetical protein
MSPIIPDWEGGAKKAKERPDVIYLFKPDMAILRACIGHCPPAPASLPQ